MNKEKCGDCKDFYKYNKDEIFGCCQSFHSKAKNKDIKSELTKACYWIRRKDEQ